MLNIQVNNGEATVELKGEVREILTELAHVTANTISNISKKIGVSEGQIHIDLIKATEFVLSATSKNELKEVRDGEVKA